MVCHILAVDSKESAGAPESEMEITPAMIEAGGVALWGRLYHDPLISPGIANDLAEDVIRAALPYIRGKMRPAPL